MDLNFFLKKALYFQITRDGWVSFSGLWSGFEILLRSGLELVAFGLGLMKFGSGQTRVKFFSNFSVNVD